MKKNTETRQVIYIGSSKWGTLHIWTNGRHQTFTGTVEFIERVSGERIS